MTILNITYQVLMEVKNKVVKNTHLRMSEKLKRTVELAIVTV